MPNSMGPTKATHYSQAKSSLLHSFLKVKILKNGQEVNVSAWEMAWQGRDSTLAPEHCSAGGLPHMLSASSPKTWQNISQGLLVLKALAS